MAPLPSSLARLRRQRGPRVETPPGTEFMEGTNFSYTLGLFRLDPDLNLKRQSYRAVRFPLD